jgi:protein-S-isoprenylcysteine O-methyltransferase Ste14
LEKADGKEYTRTQKRINQKVHSSGTGGKFLLIIVHFTQRRKAMSGNKYDKNENFSSFKIVLKGFFSLLFILASIFVLAGRLSYWQGWIFSGICVSLVFIQSILFRNKTDLARERIKPGPGTKWWDKIFFAIYVPMVAAILIIAALDAGRFGWTRGFAIGVYVLSYSVFLFSIYLFSWAMWVNKWFSSRVRIQKDRDQKVVMEGPYKIVRHPGYVGGILMCISMSIVLGSLWGLIPAGISGILIIIRTHLEDMTLQKELQGFDEYVKKVKYRILPGIW